jgi:hypothetical protein
MGCIILILTQFASAHHGRDSYNTAALILIEGEVIDVYLRDPHSVMVIAVNTDDGASIEWEVEGGAAAGIIGAGLTLDFLRSHPQVVVEGFLAKDSQCLPRCRMLGETFKFIEESE